MVRNNQLSLVQELVRHTHAFVEQTARILPQIKNQSLQVTHLVERVRNFVFGSLVKARHVHVTDSRFDQEMQVNAVARNLISDNCELQRLFRAFTQNRDVDRSAFGSLQQVRHITRAHIVGGLAIDSSDDVARPDSCSIRGRPHKRRDHNHFIVTRPDGHTYAVVFAALIFAQQRIRLGIKGVGVRIEHVQHSRNRPVVDRFVGVYRLGIILFDHVIYRGELPQAVADVGISTGSGGRIDLLPEYDPEKSAGYEDEYNQEECASRTTNHHVFLRRGDRKHPGQRVSAKYSTQSGPLTLPFRVLGSNHQGNEICRSFQGELLPIGCANRGCGSVHLSPGGASITLHICGESRKTLRGFTNFGQPPLPDCRQFSPAVSWKYEPGLSRDDLPLPFCPDLIRAKEVARDWTADREGAK